MYANPLTVSEFLDHSFIDPIGRIFIPQNTPRFEDRDRRKYRCFNDASPEQDINESSERDTPFEELPQIVQHALK